MKVVSKSSFKIESFNNGTLFAVVSEYSKYGGYYKTRKGAEKQLLKVQAASGE